MAKKAALTACVIMAFFLIPAAVSLAADKPVKKETFGQKTRVFIQKLISYPANVLQGSVNAVADTAKKTTEVVTTEVKTTGEVVTGDSDKAKAIIIEPLTGTAEVAVEAVRDTVSVPVEAAKE